MVALQTELLSRMKEGAAAKELYQFALSYVKEKNSDLESHFTKNIGHGVCNTIDRVLSCVDKVLL